MAPYDLQNRRFDNAFLPLWVWLWLPLGAVTAQAVFELLLPPAGHAFLVNENGPYEIAEFLLLLAAFGVALWILIRMAHTNLWLTGWIALAALCCLYVGGEEISWGQQFAGWNTPEFWATYNDQGETNLHNTSSWLDQKPRLLLIIGVYAGGLLFPLLQRFRPGFLPERFAVIYPPPVLAVTAGICVFVKLADFLGDVSGFYLFGRAAENEELFLFLFVLLYLLEMKGRLTGRA